jgi:hypothetical protein
MTITLAGRMVPAAVVSMGKKRGESLAAWMAARYPATVAWLERASMLWARVMRGMSSMARTVAFFAAKAFTRSRFLWAWTKPTTRHPGSRAWIRSSLGGCTVKRRLAPFRSPPRSTSSAPASWYRGSG